MIACELIAKFRLFGCFPLHYFTWFIVANYLWVLKQHFTSFAEGKFLLFPRSSVPREDEVRVDRGLEEFLACSLSQDACVAAAGRVMDDTLSADSGT
jgi:hypothetical protein